ncbi:alpha-ketoglutarate dependent taurine dioxygenase [Pseudohyphozyma bogoriensis]|nr:alpha-ketoglutarate dependent taurine dioxygenase [Pseudohyphozyma bogoriensis]
MPPTATETITESLGTLRFKASESDKPTPGPAAAGSKPSVPFEEGYKYARFLPTFDAGTKLPPLEPFEHVDPGLAALNDPEPRSFLKDATEEELTPDFGSDVSGVQLHKLSEKERQQLALFVAQRGVVAFRDQEFIDQDPEWQLNDFGAFFGRLHIHPTSGQPAEFPHFHLVYRDGGGTLNYETNEHLTSSVWHSDVTYEEQPPGLTALFLYDSPPSGGDTGYADQRGAYKHLSPAFRKILEGLEATHSGVEQANYSRSGNRGGVVKREPVINTHPIVRTHPVTGEKALFVNPQFTRRIVGLKVEESDAILKMLYDHIAKGADFQTRLRWKPRTVVLWDNRITAHTAIVDFSRGGGRRHGSPPILQIVFYSSGLGSDSGTFGKLEGAAGSEAGLATKIEELYEFLSANWCPGDEVFLFGFSRGAYEARMVASIVDKIGFLNPTQMEQFPELFVALQKQGKNPDNAEIRDSTEKLLTPFRAAAKVQAQEAGNPPFLINCVSHIELALHALALDETRKDFLPTKWKQTQKGKDKGQVLKQVWFAGSHSDVGGGWDQHDLADITLAWAVSNTANILSYDLKYINSIPNPTAPYGQQPPHNPRTGIFALTEAVVRKAPTETNDITHETVHPSVLCQLKLSQSYRGVLTTTPSLVAPMPAGSFEGVFREEWKGKEGQAVRPVPVKLAAVTAHKQGSVEKAVGTAAGVIGGLIHKVEHSL